MLRTVKCEKEKTKRSLLTEGIKHFNKLGIDETLNCDLKKFKKIAKKICFRKRENYKIIVTDFTSLCYFNKVIIIIIIIIIIRSLSVVTPWPDKNNRIDKTHRMC
jgi:hypothetical protein